ncbi:M30 family zinc metallopeptidase [Chitiniphilus shinanonensis]|uniref:M30 family zinc metallopeptidase n=1 Tax=Chitiniphilus shinanonensis TaxID=553088 RepID=UPI000475B678|nr:hypothetical protein [Chitiniphilus shinanonensis]
MKQGQSTSYRTLLFTTLLSAVLLGCGGGGGGGGGGGDPGLPPTTGAALSVDCSGANCQATDAGTYAGSGVGLWRYTNTTNGQVNVPISIAGLNDRSTVTLIYTNQGGMPVSLPAPPAADFAPTPRAAAVAAFAEDTADSRANRIPSMVRNFDAKARMGSAPSRALASRRLLAAAPHSAAVNDKRDWFISQNDNSITTRTATLQRKVTADDGRVVNIWVEDSEYGDSKFSAARVEQFAQRFAVGSQSVYSMVTRLAGQPWGPHSYPDLLIPANQELDIVFVNFDRNNRPYGMIGYFWSNNNFFVDPSVQYGEYSNESLSFYMDTETVYWAPGEEGVQIQLSTLGHELTHMINFYQRGVLMSDPNSSAFYDFETFLEESTALMTEDIIGLNLDPTFNSLRDASFADWLNSGLNNCSYPDWNGEPNTPCFSYSIAASFGGYLLRQYGIDFYKGLLRNRSSTDSLVVLDDAIRQAGGPGFAEALRRWSTMAALLPATGVPAGFGLPLRQEQGFTLPAVNGPDFDFAVRWPTTRPSVLKPYALFPVRRAPANGVYKEVVPVPINTTLSVVIQTMENQ